MLARGEVGEIWQGGRQVGTLWDWHLEGTPTCWWAEAQRQSFVGSFTGGMAEARFFLTASSESLFQFRGEGEVTEYVAGAKMRLPARIQGSRLWALTVALIPSASN